MNVAGPPSASSGQVGSPIQTGWPPNLATGSVIGSSTARSVKDQRGIVRRGSGGARYGSGGTAGVTYRRSNRARSRRSSSAVAIAHVREGLWRSSTRPTAPATPTAGVGGARSPDRLRRPGSDRIRATKAAHRRDRPASEDRLADRVSESSSRQRLECSVVVEPCERPRRLARTAGPPGGWRSRRRRPALAPPAHRSLRVE